MIRSLGVTELLGELVGPAVVLFALVTQLGDLWLLFLVAAGLYWFGQSTPVIGRGIDRRRGAMLVALVFGGAALTVAAKAIFGLPRPPGAGTPPRADLVPPALREAYAWLSTGDGYGFPSGHAIASTVVWGGLALLVDAGRRRRRVAIAAAVIGAIWLSRLVLGVHYLVDVLAGGLVGAVYLAAVVKLDRPLAAFALATAVAVVGVAVAGITRDASATLGATAGATATWWAVGDAISEPSDRRAGTVTAGLGIVVATGAVVVVAVGGTGPVVVGPVAAVGTAAVLALPLVVERVERM
ncbi:MAG: phosphatase PAP2 family protein [Haloarculaceae archaeon]